MRKTNFSTFFFTRLQNPVPGGTRRQMQDGAHTGQQARYGRKQQQTKRYRRGSRRTQEYGWNTAAARQDSKRRADKAILPGQHGGDGNPNRHCRHKADKTG